MESAINEVTRKCTNRIRGNDVEQKTIRDVAILLIVKRQGTIFLSVAVGKVSPVILQSFNCHARGSTKIQMKLDENNALCLTLDDEFNILLDLLNIDS